MFAVQSDSVTDVFDTLIRRHQAGVWRYLRALGAAPDEADDVTQDVFVALSCRRDRLPRPEAAGGLLRRIAHDRLVDRRRAERRHDHGLARRAAELEASWSEADDAPDGGPWLAALRACVEHLDESARAVVDAFYRDGLSRCAIAARHGIAEGSVKSRLFRIRAALRRCVEDRLTRD